MSSLTAEVKTKVESIKRYVLNAVVVMMIIGCLSIPLVHAEENPCTGFSYGCSTCVSSGDYTSAKHGCGWCLTEASGVAQDPGLHPLKKHPLSHWACMLQNSTKTGPANGTCSGEWINRDQSKQCKSYCTVASHQSCENCTVSRPGCGWCDQDQGCYQGYSSGPLYGSCKTTFHYGTCPKKDTTAYCKELGSGPCWEFWLIVIGLVLVAICCCLGCCFAKVKKEPYIRPEPIINQKPEIWVRVQ